MGGRGGEGAAGDTGTGGAQQKECINEGEGARDGEEGATASARGARGAVERERERDAEVGEDIGRDDDEKTYRVSEGDTV